MTSENSWTLSNNEKSPEKFQMFDIRKGKSNFEKLPKEKRETTGSQSRISWGGKWVQCGLGWELLFYLQNDSHQGDE